MPCPIKADIKSLSCNADICTDGITDYNDQPTSDKRDALDRKKSHLSAFVQRDPTGGTGATGTSSTLLVREMSDMGIERVFRYNSLS